MSHGDRTDQLPPGFHVIARSANSPVAAMADDERKIYAIQFHPEVRHTPQGTQIIHNFVYDIAHCRPTWTPLFEVRGKGPSPWSSWWWTGRWARPWPWC